LEKSPKDMHLSILWFLL